jgi:nitrite reductase (NADH) large subunit
MMGAPADTTWRCLVCGYLHRGPSPPDACPVCNASPDAFEQAPDEASAPAPSPQEAIAAPTAAASGKPGAGKRRIVVLGAGIAGLSAAEAAREAAPEADITLLSKENALPYYRLNLTRFLAGEIAERDLPIHPESWYAAKRIELRLGCEAVSADLAANIVQIRGGDRIPFGKLVWTTGAHAMVPPLPGVTREGVSALRTAGDARRLLEDARSGAVVAIVGGGILGLEAAAAVARHGATAVLLEGGNWLLRRQLNERAGQLLARHIERLGVQLRAAVKVNALLGDERVRAVELAGGERIPADAVAICTGVRANGHAAALSGLDVRQGVVVDDRLATSHPDVYAAGDVAEHHGVLYGIWGPAQYQGHIAGTNAAGGRLEFGGLPRSNTLKVLDLGLFSLGNVAPDAASTVIEGDTEGGFAAFFFREARLDGAILLGEVKAAAGIKKAAETRENLSAILRSNPGASELVLHFAGR